MNKPKKVFEVLPSAARKAAAARSVVEPVPPQPTWRERTGCSCGPGDGTDECEYYDTCQACGGVGTVDNPANGDPNQHWSDQPPLPCPMCSDEPRPEVLDSVMVLLRELQDRERLAFGYPLPETTAVIEAFADYLDNSRLNAVAAIHQPTVEQGTTYCDPMSDGASTDTPRDDELLDVIEEFIAEEVGEHFPAMREQARDLLAALGAAGWRCVRGDVLEAAETLAARADDYAAQQTWERLNALLDALAVWRRRGTR